MIISFNTGKINTNNSGGLLQQKRVEVTENGLDVVVPDAGYDGLSTVYIKTNVEGGGGSDEPTTGAWVMPVGTIFNNCSFTSFNGTGIDISNITNMQMLLAYNNKLETVDISMWDGANVTNITGLFGGDAKLKTVNMNWDLYHIESLQSLFYACTSLETPNIGKNIKANLDLSVSKNLTNNTLVDFHKNLYDFAGNGETPNENQGKLTLGSNLSRLDAVTISLYTKKGWTLA
jgi:hypothetical protein